MKIIAVGDIHGRETWKKVFEQEKDCDKFIFIGDYFDAFPPMTVDQIIKNFGEILEFKAKNPEQVELLIGNHDFQYMPVSGGTEQYSGYNSITSMKLKDMGDWWKDMKAAYQWEDILFTHAGLTKTWAEEYFPNKTTTFGITENTDKRISEVFENEPNAFKFYDKDTSHCGDDKNQSPFWVRPDALIKDIYEGLRMVVGHTHVQTVQSVGAVTQIDSGKEGSYLKIIDGVMYTGTI